MSNIHQTYMNMCQNHVKHMSKICQHVAISANLYRTYDKHMSTLCSTSVQHIRDISLAHAKHMSKICQPYVQHM